MHTVTGPSSLSAEFVYNGDGARVKSIINGETILFVGSYYEVADPEDDYDVTKYYFTGSARIAMRKYTIPQPMTVEYMLGDHLGSTSVTADKVGAKVSEIRYKPWGEIRSSSLNVDPAATTPAYTLSKFTFTGQYSYMDDPTTQNIEEGFGLMYYNARWYDPYLNHFTQPDTIIPDPTNPLDWNRYLYARGNPVRYNDPSGHNVCDEDGYCNDGHRWWKINGHASSNFTIKICGVGDGGNCSNGASLAPYTGLSGETHSYDVDDCGTKALCASRAYGFMSHWTSRNPLARFTIIGHSAGADAAILFADKAVNAGMSENIKGVVLLDPTLTARINGVDTNLQEMANKVAATVPTFLGDTAHDYYMDPTGSSTPILIDIPGAILPQPNADYPLRFDATGKLDYSHTDLALSVVVRDYIANVFLTHIP